MNLNYMTNLEDIYKKGFFSIRGKLDWRIPIFCDIVESTFDKILHPINGQSIIDVGCANGEFVEEFFKRGFNTEGIEGCLNSKEFARSKRISYHDLRFPFYTTVKRDLCICMEVAEHIEMEFASIFVDTLGRLSDVILISCALPNQKGHHHVNCQPRNYWENMFIQRDYIRSNYFETRFKSNIERYSKKKGMSGYYNNAMVFTKLNGEF